MGTDPVGEFAHAVRNEIADALDELLARKSAEEQSELGVESPRSVGKRRNKG